MRHLLGISLLIGFSQLPLPAQEKTSESVIVRHVDEMAQGRGERHTYPIENLDPIFRDQDTIFIFSYGSLLNKESAARTLSAGAMKTHHPAIAYGLVRVFDRQVSPCSAQRWGEQQSENELAMLNVTMTGRVEDRVNGVLIEVDRTDLEKLIDREVGYDLVALPVTDWEGGDVQIAYTFHATPDEKNGKTYVGCNIKPVREYALASKEGAAQYGKEFLQMWIDTTYLADNSTFAQWEKS